MAASKLDELRNLHRIIELTTYNLVSLRTQCPDDVRVKAEIRTLEAKLDRLLSKQVLIKTDAEASGVASLELGEFPDTPLWLRKLDLERYEQVFLTHNVTCDMLLRLNDRELQSILKHGLRLDRASTERVLVGIRAIKADVHAADVLAGSRSTVLPRASPQNVTSLAERLSPAISFISSPTNSQPGTPPHQRLASATQRRISHMIAHRFQSRFVLPGMCDYCRKIMVTGMVCRYCKYACHSKCARNVPPTCGLPTEYEDYFKSLITVSMVNEVDPRTPHSIDLFHAIPEDSPVMPGSPHSHRPSTSWRRYSLREPSIQRVLSLPGLNPDDSALSEGLRTSISAVNLRHDRPATPESVPRASAAVDYGLQRPESLPHGSIPRPASTSALPLTARGNPRDYRRSLSGSGVSTQSVPQSQPSRRRGLSVSVPSSSPPMGDPNQRPSRRKSVEGSSQSPWHKNATRVRVPTLGSPRTARESVSSSPLGVPASPRSLRVSRTQISLGLGPTSPTGRGSFFGRERGDWEIPYEELTFVKRLGEAGPGEVHHAKWHGDVAVKVWTIANPSEDMLRAFRREVSTLRKLRHQNILLFMGACVSPPHFAIVTKFCNGCTLYRHVHVSETHFDMGHVVDMVSQLSQGMEYLHARRVLKRKLTSKSVFVETDGKVMIGDFSLATLTTMPLATDSPLPSPAPHRRRSNRSVGSFAMASPYASPVMSPTHSRTPSSTTDALPTSSLQLAKIGPLRSLAPEILATGSPEAFTYASDVYAFGVVVYELLAMANPWPGLRPEQLIYTIVHDHQLPNVSACRDDCPPVLLDLVMDSLAYQPDERPTFEAILKAMQSEALAAFTSTSVTTDALSLQRAPSLPVSHPRRESA